MKTDVQGCSTTAPGTEHYESFISQGVNYIQYDYRTAEGKLFSTVATDLEVCRKRRDGWLKNNAN